MSWSLGNWWPGPWPETDSMCPTVAMSEAMAHYYLVLVWKAAFGIISLFQPGFCLANLTMKYEAHLSLPQRREMKQRIALHCPATCDPEPLTFRGSEDNQSSGAWKLACKTLWTKQFTTCKNEATHKMRLHWSTFLAHLIIFTLICVFHSSEGFPNFLVIK